MYGPLRCRFSLSASFISSNDKAATFWRHTRLCRGTIKTSSVFESVAGILPVGLHGAHSMNNGSYRTQNNGAIQKKALIVKIMKIVLQIFMNWECAGRTNLPQACYSGPGDKSQTFNGMITSNDKRHLWAWTHKAHLSF